MNRFRAAWKQLPKTISEKTLPAGFVRHQVWEYHSAYLEAPDGDAARKMVQDTFPGAQEVLVTFIQHE